MITAVVETKSSALCHKQSDVPKGLRLTLVTSKIWELLYSAASSFISKNRPTELQLFKKMFPLERPCDCFLNLYDVGLTSGIAKHSDHVSFCTVVLCLKGNGEGNLTLTQEDGKQPVTISLQVCELIVFARIEHRVEITIRSQKI